MPPPSKCPQRSHSARMRMGLWGDSAQEPIKKSKVLAAVCACQGLEIESAPLFFAARNENLVRSLELHVAPLGGDFDASKFSLGAIFARNGGERQKVLVLDHHSHLADIRVDAQRGAISGEKRVASSAVANLIEVTLANVGYAPVSPGPPGRGFVNSMNQDAGLLRFIDCELDVGARSFLAEIVKAVGEKQDFAARAGYRPAGDQLHQGLIDARRGAIGTAGQPDCLGDRLRVRIELRGDLKCPVGRVKHTDAS